MSCIVEITLNGALMNSSRHCSVLALIAVALALAAA